jgi:PIN like domain
MVSVYGERRAARLRDEVWLRDAGERGWVVVTADKAIRRRPAEREAYLAAGVRVFCLTSGQLRGREQLARLVENLPSILRQADVPGPWIFAVYSNRIAPIVARGPRGSISRPRKPS